LPDEKLSRRIDREDTYIKRRTYMGCVERTYLFLCTYSLHLLFGGAASGCDNYRLI